MIMGAGIYQVPLIRKAKDMGLYTIVVSIPGDYPGFAIADEVCYLNTTDQEAVLAAAKEKKVDGIVTTGTDVAVITIGRICEELGLPGLSYRAACISTDKSLMKECLAQAGVRTARFRKIPLDLPLGEALAEVSDLTYPLIVKTVDSSGSRGITRIDRPEDLEKAVDSVRKVTRKNYYLIEEFIIGKDFGAQAFVHHGKVCFLLAHGNYQFHGDTGVPAGHYIPFAMTRDEDDDFRRQLEGAIRAVGLDECAVNADLILKDGQTYIVELAGRSGATGLTELDSIYLGVDMYEQIIRTALGEEPFIPGQAQIPGKACSCELLQSSLTGTLISMDDRNDPEDPDIFEIVLDHVPGDQVRRFRVGPDRIGHIITSGNTLEEAEETLRRAKGNLMIRVEPGEGRTERT